MLDRRPRPEDRLLRIVAPAAPSGEPQTAPSGRLPTALSERVPGRLIGVFEIADIGPKARPDAGADRRQLQPLVGLEIDPEPADHVGRPLDPDEMVENLRRFNDVVDENQCPRPVAADIETGLRPRPL